MALSDYDTDPGNNTNLPSSGGGDLFIGEGCASSVINNGLRQIMADLAAMPLDEQTVITDFSKTLLDNDTLEKWQDDLEIVTLSSDAIWTGNHEFTEPVTFSINIWDTNDGFSYDKVTDTAVWNISTVGAMSLKATGLRLVNGEYFDEFSDDETLADDSATAAVSERAIKAYIAEQIGNAVHIGSMEMIAYSTPDSGWLLCDGSEVSRTTYAALWAKIQFEGWGDGDGTTTFNLPDLRDRVPRGSGTKAGAAGNYLEDQVGPHGHNLQDPGHGHPLTDPGHTHSYSQSYTGSNTVGGSFPVFNLNQTISTGSSTTGITIDDGPTGITIDDVTTDETRVKSATVNWQIKY